MFASSPQPSMSFGVDVCRRPSAAAGVCAADARGRPHPLLLRPARRRPRGPRLPHGAVRAARLAGLEQLLVRRPVRAPQLLDPVLPAGGRGRDRDGRAGEPRGRLGAVRRPRPERRRCAAASGGRRWRSPSRGPPIADRRPVPVRARLGVRDGGAPRADPPPTLITALLITLLTRAHEPARLPAADGRAGRPRGRRRPRPVPAPAARGWRASACCCWPRPRCWCCGCSRSRAGSRSSSATSAGCAVRGRRRSSRPARCRCCAASSSPTAWRRSLVLFFPSGVGGNFERLADYWATALLLLAYAVRPQPMRRGALAVLAVAVIAQAVPIVRTTSTAASRSAPTSASVLERRGAVPDRRTPTPTTASRWCRRGATGRATTSRRPTSR